MRSEGSEIPAQVIQPDEIKIKQGNNKINQIPNLCKSGTRYAENSELYNKSNIELKPLIGYKEIEKRSRIINNFKTNVINRKKRYGELISVDYSPFVWRYFNDKTICSDRSPSIKRQEYCFSGKYSKLSFDENS